MKELETLQRVFSGRDKSGDMLVLRKPLGGIRQSGDT
jgi:hypothetical protein